MTSPKLSVSSSGMGGRGYRAIFQEGQPIVPSITTVLGAIDHPGLRQWERQQIAAFAVTHLDEIAAKDEEVGYRYLMAVPKFLTPEKADALPPEVDVWHAAEYALNEAANTGTWIHSYIEDDLLDRFPEDPQRRDHEQMVIAYLEWKAQHDIRVLHTEFTVFGDGYAGTGDWILEVDGVLTLGDNKSSRAVRESHIAQLGAIGAGHYIAKEVPANTDGAVMHKLQPKVAEEHGGQKEAWFVEEPLPEFQQYAVLQVRPDDWDNNGAYVPAFCEMHVIPQAKVEAGYEMFRGALAVRLAQKRMKDLDKM